MLNSVPPDLPASLAEPIFYFLKMPGKKIRPLLVLSACEAVGGKPEDALPAAVAVELFHDFTLIHDDIMDQDELRRGLQTLHVKYGNPTAILVGDLLIGVAYKVLLRSPAAQLKPVLDIFTDTLVKVCEGQALDEEFEKRAEVRVEEYLDMIGKKTAWLIQTACALGAICGGGNPEQVQHLSRFGYAMGLAFQIQDDLLDFIADETMLGKKIGSDFRMDKKTYVLLKYKQTLRQYPHLQSNYPLDIHRFTEFEAFQKALHELGIVDAVKQDADRYFDEAVTALQAGIGDDRDNPLYQLIAFLQNRQY